MRNLENKHYISVYQFALLIFSMSHGGQIVLGMRSIIAQAEQGTWLSIILGGLLYGGAALLMVILGRSFPEETFAEYLPRIWGRWVGGIILFWLNIVMLLQMVVIITGFSRATSMFMFALTPLKLIGLGMIVIVIYCTLQDIGTILRVVQITFFLQTVFILVLGSLTCMNIELDNLLPILPRKLSQVAGGAVSTYSMFSGYELLLLLLPLLGQKAKAQVPKILGYTFLYLTLIFAAAAVVIIGVMTVEGAKNTPYPTIIAIRAVELPGTFIERLENYLILAWVPAVFDTLVLILYMTVQFCARFFYHRDHRPWVLLFGGLIFLSFDLIDDVKSYELANKVANWLGISFSGVAIPATLAMSWWQKRRGCG